MKITSNEAYYVLLCDTSKWEPKKVRDKYPPLICGVYASKKEAQEAAAEVKDCPAKHLVKKCQVTVKLL